MEDAAISLQHILNRIYHITATVARVSGGNQLHLQLWANAGTLAGNVWNVLLYLPLGWTAAKVWEKMDWIGIMLTGVGLSCLCEFLQFWTARGTADLNDIFSNGIGAATGAIVVCWIDRKGRTNREQKP